LKKAGVNLALPFVLDDHRDGGLERPQRHSGYGSHTSKGSNKTAEKN
jgi:hypothetical protein